MAFYLYPALQTVSASSPIKISIDGVPADINIDTLTPANTVALPSGQWFKDQNGAVEVYQDTANEANTKPLPTGTYYIKDGVVTPVLLDTVTPANTNSIPVTLVDVTGVPATINVTTGDLSVEISHDGLPHTWDSTRVGDGTNLMGVNADLEALVHDLDTHARLDTLNAKDFATSAKQDTLQTKVDTLATEAKQDAIITELQAIKTQALDTVEDFYKRDFVSSPLTVASGWVTLRTLTAAIKKISVINNSGNELLIRNQTTNKSIIVGQGAAFDSSLIGAIADVIELQAFGADAVDGIIYINFEG